MSYSLKSFFIRIVQKKLFFTIQKCQAAYSHHAHLQVSAKALAAAHIKFARFFLGVSEFQRALDPLNTALSIRPNYPAALKDRAFAFSNLGLFQQAQADLLAAQALDPFDDEISNALLSLLRSSSS
mmetsp:Transcript_18564/g.27975  ORF Transcript_18564/g.27975 Transcript_18564/m.27975 type:complete len:126 (+) Transcript_18564:713-1090(+)